MNAVRDKSLSIIKGFKTIKEVIWESAISVSSIDRKEIPREKRIVDVKLLMLLMEEIDLLR